MKRRDLSRVTARIAQSKNIQNETFKNAFKINHKSHKSEKSKIENRRFSNFCALNWVFKI